MVIDPVALDRLEIALKTGTALHFEVPIRADERPLYYRELVYLGHTPTAIARLTGWNIMRIQEDLTDRSERRGTNAIPLSPRYTEPNAVGVDTRPGSIILTIDGRPHIIEGHQDDLLTLGRLIYSAATSHHEEMTA